MNRKFLVLFSFLILTSYAYAQEQLTITTYYPSPNGVYKRLQAETAVIGSATNSAINTTLLDNGNIGIFGNNDAAIILGTVPTGSATGYGWRIANAQANGSLSFTYANPYILANPPASTWSGSILTLSPLFVSVNSQTPPVGTQFFVEGDAIISHNLSVGGAPGGGYLSAGVQMSAPTIYGSNIYAGNSKSFLIKHPTKPGKFLIHASLEGPESGVYYRGEAQLVKGKAKIKLPDYFEALTRKDSRTVLLTVKGTEPFLLSCTNVSNGEFSVYGTNQDGQFFWEVKAVRADIEPLKVESDSKKFAEYFSK